MNFYATSFGKFCASPRFASFVLATLAAVAWIATHRYQRIWHDGVLYAGQAIFRLDPTPFSTDLFFAYGSQGDFTAFTGIYALAIATLGLPVASAVLLGIAHLAWVAAAAFLLRGVLTGLAFWLGLILISVLPTTYGSFGIFSYSEAFLTARVWAEPLALLAVAFSLRGNRLTAMLSVAFAAAMHPIIALPAALLVFFFGFQGREKLAWIAVGLVGLAVLSIAQVSLVTNLTRTMDPVWLTLAKTRAPFIFLDLWQAAEYREPMFLALLLTTAALVSARGNSRLWWSAIGVVLVGMGLSLLVVYWPGVLLVQIQPWRVLWLTKILAVAAGMSLLQDGWSVSPYSRILLGALVTSASSLDSTGLICAVPLCALIVIRHRFGLEPKLPPWLSRLAWGAIVLLIGEKIFWAALLSSSFTLDFTAASLSSLTLANRLFIFFKETSWFVFPSLLLFTWWLLRHRRPISLPIALLMGVALLFFVAHWQPSSPYQVAEDHLRETGHAELAHIIQPHHLTYWGAGHDNLWFFLHRGSYASFQQAAGIVFSRQTALEADRRLARLRRLGLPDSRLGRGPEAADGLSGESTTLDGLVHVCHDPILDFVVLSEPVAGTIPMKTVRLSLLTGDYHVYSCAALRSSFPDPFAD